MGRVSPQRQKAEIVLTIAVGDIHMLENKFGEPLPSRHAVGGANFHLQFTPKYRRDVFRDEAIKRACEESFRKTAKELGLVINALAFGPEHVHIFLGACKNYSVAEIAKRFKGASSRRIRKECWDRVKSKLWGEAFWSGGYFYRSVGSTTSESIQYYIERSQGKHWTALDYEEYEHRKEKQTTIGQFIA